GLLLIFSFVMAPPALAGEPMDIVKENVNTVLEVLRDPALQGPENKEKKREKARKIVNDRFDFEEISRRSLGRHWTERSEEEKKEFVEIFSEFLERSYMNRIEGHTADEVLFLSEEIRGGKAEVRTKAVTEKGTEVPINYRLFKKNGRWMVYDVVIEGVSLVSSYRTQFNEIIRGSSYEGLVKSLREKLEREG
ncbi:MAG: ABC transporter substrate-binding protein, partial [Deltaproteobacteria bacterium]|nr:ABC transporter substrate-binding protein [Deltaproteobacteria bacterium]